MTELDPTVAEGAWSGLGGGFPLSLPEQVAAKISAEILQGLVPPGSRLHEQALANRFQVSRGPVREALRLLERDGLAQITARRGARVSALSFDELGKLLGLRIALNGLVARSAAEHADPATLIQLQTLINSLEGSAKTATPEAFVLTGYQALKVLCQATGNPHLTRLVFYMSHQTLRYARLGLDSVQARERYAGNWRLILTTVMAGKPDAAQAAGEGLVREPLERAKAHLTLQSQENRPRNERKGRRPAVLKAGTPPVR